MSHTDTLSITELRECVSTFKTLSSNPDLEITLREWLDLKHLLLSSSSDAHDNHNISKLLHTLKCALVFSQEIDADRDIILAILLAPMMEAQLTDILKVRQQWGADVASLITGIGDVERFSNNNSLADQDNFRGLILSLADDIRVVIIMIVRSLVLMRSINLHPDTDWVQSVAFEANCLYAQLAHRLGLYKIKGELEDLSLKYSNREIYKQIAHKLNETKASRDAYIHQFITPLKQRLKDAGLKFEIKGRTKSISSIWNKMKKQKVDLNGIYDLFAIRVIIDTPAEKEKSDCWLAYSILADMYIANPARMRDWISIPKSNGYESLHATVMGPEQKWVEVQFRTRRMDLVAEKGLAAHWRYKGGHADTTDQWMNNVRDVLETAHDSPMQMMKNLRVDVYSREVFAFTPKGDLYRLPAGATVLDFAFMIHTNVGAHCTGARINGQLRKITSHIHSGDTVEIITSSQQQPRREWLKIAVSPRARTKIRQSLNEQLQIRADLGRELFERRAKNRKLSLDETLLMKLIKKAGYRQANEFWADMADEKIDAAKFLNSYEEAVAPEENVATAVSADEFELHPESGQSSSDPIIIGNGEVKGINFKFAQCCNPVKGDEVFGFISALGVIKIHRAQCPNALNLRAKHPERVCDVKWSDSPSTLTSAVIRILGNDDIGILANITSLISKEPDTLLRNVSIDSHDGIFQGLLTVATRDTQTLATLIKRLQGVKGVKSVERT